MSSSKKRGTAWETAVCRLLAVEGFPHVERRALNGTQDRGDVAGIPGVVIEAKNCRQTQLAAWVDEAAIEQANDGADYSAVWHHRRGKASPADGFVTMTGATFVRLLRAAGYGGPPSATETAQNDAARDPESPDSYESDSAALGSLTNLADRLPSTGPGHTDPGA